MGDAWLVIATEPGKVGQGLAGETIYGTVACVVNMARPRQYVAKPAGNHPMLLHAHEVRGPTTATTRAAKLLADEKLAVGYDLQVPREPNVAAELPPPKSQSREDELAHALLERRAFVRETAADIFARWAAAYEEPPGPKSVSVQRGIASATELARALLENLEAEGWGFGEIRRP